MLIEIKMTIKMCKYDILIEDFATDEESILQICKKCS